FVIEVGWSIAENTWVDLPFVADVLPAGRYAVASYSGPYSRLEDVTTELLMWADLEGLTFDTGAVTGVETWASRMEVYLDDPRMGPEGLEGSAQVCMMVRE